MTSAGSVREYRAADADAVRTLVGELQDYERCIDERLRPGDAMAAEYFGGILAQCAKCSGKIFVADVNGVVAGFVTILTRVPFESLDDPPGEYALISDLVVADAFRRAGLGRQLLDAAERHALAAGANEVRVSVLSGNDTAASLYRRSGFQPYLETLSKRLST